MRGRVFFQNEPVWAHAGLGHGIPPRITKWNGNRSDRGRERSLVRTQGVSDDGDEERSNELTVDVDSYYREDSTTT